MKKYLEQLLADLANATENVSWPFTVKELELHDWLSPEDENKSAPIRDLEYWTGIKQIQFPQENMLDDEQVQQLLIAINKILDAYNCSFVLQIQVSERIQYEALRQNFKQDVKVKRWHKGFFEPCSPNTKHRECTLKEYCQCAFFADLFSNFIEEDLSPEEERSRELEWEITRLKKKYGNKWMKYYPYHLHADYDDEYGNSFDSGMDDENDHEDDWWRK